ncbi:MAG: ABC transporter permease, partial [Planctomycetes bacterium]|nr:ABC transporter permease [Planctomycetota bacterium]
MARDEVRSHPLRALLTMLSVAIGIGAVVAIHGASTSARHAFVQLHESLTGKVDLEVVSEDGSRFDASLAAVVSRVEGVAHVIPILRRTTILYANGKRVTTSVLGVDGSDPDAVSSYKLVAGRFWQHRSDSDDTRDAGQETTRNPRIEVLLETNLAKSLGVKVGDTATFLLPSGPTRTVVIGLLSLRSAASLTQPERAIFLLADLQQAARLEGKIDQLQVLLAEDESTADVRKRLLAVLPPGMAVRMPVTQTDLADATLKAANQGLRFAQAVALAMAMIIILNTFLISVAQRYRQWGLLRAVGATRRQVIGLLLAEALAVGLAGSLVGVAAGLFFARYLAAAIGRTLHTQVQEIELSPALAIVAILLGPLLSVLACYVPARKACRVSPIEALRGDVPTSDARVPWSIVILACVVWLCSLSVIILCIAGRLAAFLAIPAGLGMMLGFVLMVPPILPSVARWLTRLLLRPIWPVESQLALDQIFTSQLRASLTVAVVVVALANAIGLGHELLNSVDDVRDWYRRSMFADVLLMPATPDMAAEFGLKAKDRPQALMQQIPGVADVQTIRFVPARANDR